MKILSVGAELLDTDGLTERRTERLKNRRKDRYDEATSRFPQFCEDA